MSDEACAFCEETGTLIKARGMPGMYHLRCIADARKAWESAKGKSLLKMILDR